MANLINFKNSIIENGGASYNLLTGEFNPNDGYMVSIPDHELRYTYHKESLQYNIADYIQRKAIILASGITEPNHFVGAWVEDGQLFMDVSIKVNTEEEARELAKNGEQIAYFDNAKKQTVYAQ